MPGYGGLIASRTTDDSVQKILNYLDVLRTLPATTVYAFNVITRISDANYNLEEPLYWETYGKQLHRYSQMMHRVQAGVEDADKLAAVRDKLPDEPILDFTQRRLRNHQVNLQMLQLAREGVIDLLVVSSDDTSEYGFGTQEKDWLTIWRDRLYLDDSRLLMYPGADEVGCVLLMRAVLASESTVPRFYCHYAIEGDKERIAPYEDAAVRITVERQIRAIGGVNVDDISDADFIVAVNPPSRIGQEYDPEMPLFDEEHQRRAPSIKAFAAQIASWLYDDKRVIVCDVGYPNGSDPDLIEQLFEHVPLHRLAAYGAWNTAGNTIGTALAQGVAASRAVTEAQQTAQQRFLVHRFVEDWGYQHVVRQQIRDWLENETGIRDTTPETITPARERIEEELAARLEQIPGMGEQWRITPGSVRLPWQRTFEVDFDLEHI
jgi:hypothetical protein